MEKWHQTGQLLPHWVLDLLLDYVESCGATLVVVTHIGQDGLREDHALHGHLAYNVAINLLDGFKHYSYETPTWLRVGLGHLIEREINPTLKKDAGRLELIDVDGNRVLVRLGGSCAVCAKSPVTLKHYVESRLRELVSPELVVEEVQ